jgi:hypothetical protein
MAQTNQEPTVSLIVKPPEIFSFQPHDWILWRKRFERYRLISDLRNAPAKTQVDMLELNSYDDMLVETLCKVPFN